jgi:hypothetical protein
MKDYIVGILMGAYDFINPEYARNRRMAEFEGLKESGKLEGMCSFEVHRLFGIHKISKEF